MIIVILVISLSFPDFITLLQEAGYNYILGARIKSESVSVKQWILSLEKVDKACYNYKRENGERLIVSYSDKRAKKDAYNRDRGIARLRKAYKTGRITKSQVNKRGYNKFLEISKDIEVVISEEKIAEDLLHQDTLLDGETPCSQATFRPTLQHILIWVAH